MSEQYSFKRNSELTAQACAWIAQLESESMTSDDLSAFKEWGERSPAHKEEISRLARLSSELNVLTDMEFALKEATARQKKPLQLKRRLSWTKLSFVSVSALFLIVIAIKYFYFSNIFPATDEPLMYSTNIGESREVLLSDGTLLNLNTNSEVEVDYSRQRRKVRLLKGEAFFRVSHDAKRPFVVYAGESVVRAIGTAFAVSLLPKVFEVTVTEGKVELLDSIKSKQVETEKKATRVALTGVPVSKEVKTSQKPTAIYLKAGETVVFNESDKNKLGENLVETISEREIRRKLSWQDGLLDFSDTPLVKVIDDLSRYTSMKIEISDPELRDMKFGGLFRTDELQALFDALENTFDVKVERISENYIRLSRNIKSSM